MKQNQFKKVLLLMTMFVGAHASWAAAGDPITIPGTSNAAVTLDVNNATRSGGKIKNQGDPAIDTFDSMGDNATALFNLNNTIAQRYTVSYKAGTANSNNYLKFTIKNGETTITEKQLAVDQTDWTVWKDYSFITDQLPVSDNLTLTITFISGQQYTSNMGDITFTPVDESITTYTLTTLVTPVGAGTVTATPAQDAYTPNTSITLTQTAAYGYQFVKWVDGNDQQLSTEASYTFDITANTTVKAVYEVKDMSISLPVAYDDFALENGQISAHDGRAKFSGGHTDYVGNGDHVTWQLRSSMPFGYAISFKASSDNDGAALNFVITDSNDQEVYNQSQDVAKDGWNTFNEYVLAGSDILPAGNYTLTVNFTQGVNLQTVAFAINKVPTAITANRWSTIVLPFAVDNVESIFGTGTQVAQLNSVAGNTLSFQSVTSMNANEPYMIKTATDFVTADISGVTIVEGTPAKTVSGVTFQGVYEAGNIPAGAYFVSGNQLYRASDATNTIKPFKAYFTSTSAAPELTFVIGGETTGIDASLMNSEQRIVNSVFDLQGRKVANPTKGLYIVNGKKMIIK